MQGGCSANLCASSLSSAWCVSAHREKKTTVVRWKEIWAACDWKKARESAEAATLHLSVGGNCQSDSWYRSNRTPLRLAALVLVRIRTNGAAQSMFMLEVRAFGCFCRAHGVPVGVAGLWLQLVQVLEITCCFVHRLQEKFDTHTHATQTLNTIRLWPKRKCCFFQDNICLNKISGASSDKKLQLLLYEV